MLMKKVLAGQVPSLSQSSQELDRILGDLASVGLGLAGLNSTGDRCMLGGRASACEMKAYKDDGFCAELVFITTHVLTEEVL